MSDFDPLAGLGQPAPTPNPLDGIDFDAIPAPDVNTEFIRVTTTNGSANVPVELAHTINGVPGYTVAEVLALAQIYTQAGSEFWVNGNPVGNDFVVVPGQSLTVIGPAKGG